MSHGGDHDDTAACCILGVCCRRGGRKQVAALGRLQPAEILDRFQLVPLALLQERPQVAELLDYEMRRHLERRGVAIEEQAEE